MDKTAASILQELMTKMNGVVQYDLLHQSGPPHNMIFKYQCTAGGVSAITEQRSKKDARQVAAALCLEKLQMLGKYRPPPTSANAHAPPPRVRTAPLPATDQGEPINSYVALLNEFCTEYRMPAPTYELESDSGPPHDRQFEISVAVGANTRRATAGTKKLARQLAAEQLYKYLKENLGKVTKDFNESEALVAANLKAQDKYTKWREEAKPWRPNLGQIVSEHHLGLKKNSEPDAVAAAQRLLGEAPGKDPVNMAELVLGTLGLEYEWTSLPSDEDDEVVVVLNVLRATPNFCLASPPACEAVAKQRTARQVLEYVATMLL